MLLLVILNRFLWIWVERSELVIDTYIAAMAKIFSELLQGYCFSLTFAIDYGTLAFQELTVVSSNHIIFCINLEFCAIIFYSAICPNIN